jgi:hypothetical protein
MREALQTGSLSRKAVFWKFYARIAANRWRFASISRKLTTKRGTR